MGRLVKRVSPSVAVAITVVALMFLDQWLDAFGPMVLSEQHWLGNVLSVVLFVIGILILIGFGAYRLDWHSDRWLLPVVAVGIASFALLGVFGAIEDTVADHAFSERGRTTGCRVLHVEARVEMHGTGPTYVEIAGYDHRLNCGAALGQIMITDAARAGDPGRYVRVQYDPTGLLDPRFEENLDDSGFPLLLCAAGLVFAVGLWSFAESRAVPKVPAEPSG